MRVPTPDINDTTKRFPRSLTSAFGPYAGQEPIYGPEDNVNTPYNLGDLCVVLLCLFIVLLAVLAVDPSIFKVL